MPRKRKSSPPPNTLDRRTRIRLALESGLDERTVERALRGITKPHPLTERAITEAMQTLGVQP
jgi:hypothetical protein